MSQEKVCGMTTEVYSRVVGYFRPVQNWNDGKKEEFRERRPYRQEYPEFKPSARTENSVEI